MGEIIETYWSKSQINILKSKAKENNMELHSYLKYIICRKLEIENGN